jgi:hypothetical protein
MTWILALVAARRPSAVSTSIRSGGRRAPDGVALGRLGNRGSSTQPATGDRDAEEPATSVLADARRAWWNGPGRPFGRVLLGAIEHRYGQDAVDEVVRADRSVTAAYTESDLPNATRLINDTLKCQPDVGPLTSPTRPRLTR